MLKNKTIQMDAPLIDSIEKKMAADRNFSFQAVTRDYIEIGMEAEKVVHRLKLLYKTTPENVFLESLLAKLSPRDIQRIKEERAEAITSEG